MRRWTFIALFGAAMASGPIPARAQQTAKPTIGYLGFTAVDERPNLLTAFLQGLEQTGSSPATTSRSTIVRPTAATSDC